MNIQESATSSFWAIRRNRSLPEIWISYKNLNVLKGYIVARLWNLPPFSIPSSFFLLYPILTKYTIYFKFYGHLCHLDSYCYRFQSVVVRHICHPSLVSVILKTARQNVFNKIIGIPREKKKLLLSLSE